MLLLKPFSCEGHANFLELKFLECLYFLDIYSIIPNSKDLESLYFKTAKTA
ncbi:hypothetical protein [Helicobacter pylori]|uniref:hypothetical protein n=1 Tax=Helicobacter pylori TaxID=210 RepID=UPI0015E7C0DE|nr:hypothetical protein [Helicobacter pylori]WRF23476.1 hypothetical protein KVE95_00645 [Helicobacter pylori]